MKPVLEVFALHEPLNIDCKKTNKPVHSRTTHCAKAYTADAPPRIFDPTTGHPFSEYIEETSIFVLKD